MKNFATNAIFWGRGYRTVLKSSKLTGLLHVWNYENVRNGPEVGSGQCFGSGFFFPDPDQTVFSVSGSGLAKNPDQIRICEKTS